MDKNLFEAVLAMDSYNRGNELNEKPGVFVGRRDASSIGVASVTSASDPFDDKNYGFFAQAYNWGGRTVISYRGTQTTDTGILLNDIYYGWTIGLGFPTTAQATLAESFYETVTHSLSIYSPSTALVVGHSLGGALAGLVSTLSGTEGIGYDYQPFTAAASLHDPGWAGLRLWIDANGDRGGAARPEAGHRGLVDADGTFVRYPQAAPGSVSFRAAMRPRRQPPWRGR